ncbi:hypothetical protein Cni_G27060 [Canna indica]|uniref:Uncharacterized protein n=1 Tax=Canna indica TaxID=4628 RepID=A0AAQ3L062_9LILI|nr:hypothetical protein Cni_G27060 [Canna indica]
MSQNADQIESLQMSTYDTNIYSQANDWDSFAGGFPSSQQLQDKMVFSDAPSDDMIFRPDNVELNGHLYSPDVDTSGFEMIDNLLEYFEATDHNLHYNTDGFWGSSERINSSDVPNFSGEVDGGNCSTSKGTKQVSDRSVLSGASSSSSPYGQSNDKREKVTAAPDDQMKDAKNKTAREHLLHMLGSIPAPPAFAGEFPAASGKSIAQISATHSASPIHVTAGFLHIYGSTMPENGGDWSLQKNGHAGFIFSYSMTDNVVRKPAVPELRTKAFVLAISCKVGMKFMTWMVVF